MTSTNSSTRQTTGPLPAPTHRGVSASVHSGNLVCGGKSHSVHSKQGVSPGRMTLGVVWGEGALLHNTQGLKAWGVSPGIWHKTYALHEISMLYLHLNSLVSLMQAAFLYKPCVPRKALCAAVDHRLDC